MEDINKFRVFNKLKSVYRANSVDIRKESSAEHSWSCLLLADFFLTLTDSNLDRLRVYELLMYHDVVEIEAGDTPLHLNVDLSQKQVNEFKAAKILTKKLPFTLQEKYFKLFEEFEEQKSLEAKFAKAIDALDSQIHELDYKEDWKGWTKEFLINKKRVFLLDFPELIVAFDELIVYLEENEYFDNN